VFESELLFSEFYHSWHGFFTRVPPFNALPGMFLTLYSSIIIIQLKRRFVAFAWSRFEHVIFKRFHIKRNKIVKDFKQCLDN
jgi:hypothetical protein